MEESVFFASSDKGRSGRNVERGGDEGTVGGEDDVTFVGVDKGADGSDGGGRVGGEKDTVAMAGGAVSVDADGIAIDALEYDGAAAADIAELRAVGFNVSGRTTIKNGLAGGTG